ncbi:MAG: hypothetical protein U0794_15220 [Isosphaeraceae bacterium]
MERLDGTRMRKALKGAGELALAVVLMISAAGCRSTKPEVPPGRGFSPETGQAPPVNFSSQPNMNALNNMPGTLGSGIPGGGQLGAPGSSAANPYGAPTANGYGPPGTSGLGVSPSMGAATGAGIPPSLTDPVTSPASAPATAPGGSSGVSVPTPNPF